MNATSILHCKDEMCVNKDRRWSLRNFISSLQLIFGYLGVATLEVGSGGWHSKNYRPIRCTKRNL